MNSNTQLHHSSCLYSTMCAHVSIKNSRPMLLPPISLFFPCLPIDTHTYTYTHASTQHTDTGQFVHTAHQYVLTLWYTHIKCTKGLKAELKRIYYYNWGSVHAHTDMLLNYTSTACNTQPQLSGTCNVNAATSRKFVKV